MTPPTVVRMTSSYTTFASEPAGRGYLYGAQTAGTFIHDLNIQVGTGLLDEYNGRFEKTPEYVNGTYCYHVTVDANGQSVPTL